MGGGLFTHFSLAPSRFAWDAFGEKNGAPTYETMRRRIERYRRVPPSPHEEYEIGCVLLTQPFFFERANDPAERYLEGAACHGCLFIAECSCERFNRYLDRALVVPAIGHDPELAFFSERP